MRWLKLPAWKVGDCGFEPHSDRQVSKKRNVSSPYKFNIVGCLRDREVAWSASDRQGSNFESCVLGAVSSHHPQEVLLAQFSLYVHKGGLKPHSFYFHTHVGLNEWKGKTLPTPVDQFSLYFDAQNINRPYTFKASNPFTSIHD